MIQALSVFVGSSPVAMGGGQGKIQLSAVMMTLVHYLKSISENPLKNYEFLSANGQVGSRVYFRACCGTYVKGIYHGVYM